MSSVDTSKWIHQIKLKIYEEHRNNHHCVYPEMFDWMIKCKCFTLEHSHAVNQLIWRISDEMKISSATIHRHKLATSNRTPIYIQIACFLSNNQNFTQLISRKQLMKTNLKSNLLFRYPFRRDSKKFQSTDFEEKKDSGSFCFPWRLFPN